MIKEKRPLAGGTIKGKSSGQRYDNWHTEYGQFAEYLKKNDATATMVAVALNIYRPNCCRYKAWLQDAGLLWEVRKGICAVTGFPAKYLTTDPAKRPKKVQTELFAEGGLVL